MKVLISNRELIYKVVRACFDHQGTRPWAAELGVLDGRNAEVIDQLLDPEKLFLVDAWSTEAFDDYRSNNQHRPWVNDVDDYAYYFGGSLSEQSTMDRLFDKALKLFEHKPHTTIIKSATVDAKEKISALLGDRKLDYIYVDASHQYESVLDDLMLYESLLGPNGMLQLNDCCYSAQGIRQNLGVLEATLTFMKMADFKPVLLTNTDWTDVLLVRCKSDIDLILDQLVETNDITYVELPTQLLGALRVKVGKRANLSFR
jgi:hypothetical protein